ncbi:hypothetical protein P73_3771 [Celeribacter indicus]|uniref:Uncharacterized protein n=2 Tax=Celeribacter indicus TaxID=1208324 RepID=A0A0B5E622_9RHOB|nr:hypothetical protein P73_3771 [Celeribacter indicus]
MRHPEKLAYHCLEGQFPNLREPVGIIYFTEGATMNLSDFAKQLPKNFTEQEFVDLMNQVIDLKTIADLPAAERSALFNGVQYLVDFIMLAQEANGELLTHQGHPVVDYGGPFIPHFLVRPEGFEMDRTALETFGVGEADKYFGNK